jgi:DNA-binding beta-propeller fold protein YncE
MNMLCCAMLMSMVFTAEFAAAQSQPADPLRLVQQFEANAFRSRIGHLALDNKRNRLFVAVGGSNTVEVIDLNTTQSLPPLTSLGAPQDVLYLPDSDSIAVSSSGHGKVFFYDAETLKLKGSTIIQRNANYLRYDPAAKLVYVVNGTTEITVLNPETFEVIRTMDLKHTIGAFELEPNTKRLFANLSDKAEVHVVDRETGELLETWSLAEHEVSNNVAMALVPKEHHLFVAAKRPARMIVFDTSTGKTISVLGLISDCETIAFDPNTKRVYATCGMGTIDVFRQASPGKYELEARIPTATGARTSLFAPERQRLYLVSPGSRESIQGVVRVYETDAKATTETPATEPDA